MKFPIEKKKHGGRGDKVSNTFPGIFSGMRQESAH